MNENKNPVIQSVFDRKLQAADESFFVKASYELKDYLKQINTNNEQYIFSTDADEKVQQSHVELAKGAEVGVLLLDSFINSFDVMSQDEQVFF